MLSKDPNIRPSIHQILKTPVIEKRIKRFLTTDIFKEEFAHGLLHNQNVFEEFKKMKALEAEKAGAEGDLTAEQLPQAYLDKYKDPDLFNQEYNKYVSHINADMEESSDGGNNSFKQSLDFYTQTVSTDRDEPGEGDDDLNSIEMRTS